MPRPHGNATDSRQVEATLLEEVRATQKAYSRAAVQHKKAIEALRAGQIEANLDGSQLMHSLALAEHQALERYSEAVKALADAVLRGVEPSAAARPGISVKTAVFNGTGVTEDEPAHKVAGIAEDHITPRERQVLALIASGKSSRQIAARLGIAFKTVVVHRYHLQTKLNAHNTAELTKAALRMGLIEL